MLNALIQLITRKEENHNQMESTLITTATKANGSTEGRVSTNSPTGSVERLRIIKPGHIEAFLGKSYEEEGYEIGLIHGNKDLLDTKIEELTACYMEAGKKDIEILQEMLQVETMNLTKIGDLMPTTVKLLEQRIQKLTLEIDLIRVDLEQCILQKGRIAKSLSQLKSGFKKGLDQHIYNNDILKRFEQR